MKYEYEAIFTMDLGKAVPEVGALLNSVNGFMGECGFDEKLKVRSQIQKVIVTVDRKLTEEEQNQMCSIMEAHMIESLPQYDIRLTEFKQIK